jgi:hypothetical protein
MIAESDGRHYLVGEWHTHPSGAPHLSYTDTASLSAIADNPAVGVERPAALVVAPTLVPNRRVSIGAFLWQPDLRRPKRERLIVAHSNG